MAPLLISALREVALGRTPRIDTPQAEAQKIVHDAAKGKTHDIAGIDAKLARIDSKDPQRATEVRKAVEALLTPIEVGELRRAGDHRAAVAAGKPEIVTLPDGTKTDGFGVRMSGAEPAYDPKRWNTGDDTQATNNCYAYATNNLQAGRAGKPQPGEQAGLSADSWSSPTGEIDIAELKDAIAADGKGGKISWLGDKPTDTLKAPKGAYIVALVVDSRGGIQDYHWYRHNPDGLWSGKSGGDPAKDVDAAGKRIVDPRTADRNYGSFPIGGGKTDTLDYNRFVGYYAVMPGAKVGP